MAGTELPKLVSEPHSPADLAATLPNPGADGYQFFEHNDNHRLEKSTEFRKVNAWWAIELSYLSYATDPQYALDQVRAAGLNGAVFGFESQVPPHILIAHNAEVVVVAFRGTRVDQLPDILADITFLPQLTTQGLVHRGFQKALISGDVWNEAQKYISGIAGSQVILFTGHSLGAAMATLARRSFDDPSGRAMTLYTFGSPRVGDQVIYCTSYPGPAYRMVNDEDVVTHIPTPPIYGHIGTPLGADCRPLAGSIWESLEHRFAAAGAALAVFSFDARRLRLREFLSPAHSLKPIGDHAPRTYAAKIWNALIGS